MVGFFLGRSLLKADDENWGYPWGSPETSMAPANLPSNERARRTVVAHGLSMPMPGAGFFTHRRHPGEKKSPTTLVNIEKLWRMV